MVRIIISPFLRRDFRLGKTGREGAKYTEGTHKQYVVIYYNSTTLHHTEAK